MANVESSFYYDMSGKKYLIIINKTETNYEKKMSFFEETEFYAQQHGIWHDVQNLTDTFTALGYTVVPYNDLPREIIIRTLTDFCQSDHSDTSCVAVAVLTLGTNSKELMAADEPYILTELCDILHNGNLAGKPKIVFVKGCRQGHMGYSSSIPPHFLIMYATIDDDHSFHDSSGGSFLINAVCETLREHPELKFGDFITIVNQKVTAKTARGLSNPDMHNMIESPETKFTFMKSLVFRHLPGLVAREN